MRAIVVLFIKHFEQELDQTDVFTIFLLNQEPREEIIFREESNVSERIFERKEIRFGHISLDFSVTAKSSRKAESMVFVSPARLQIFKLWYGFVPG